jgi:hypothetical protein
MRGFPFILLFLTLPAGGQSTIPIKGSAWRLAVADLNADSRGEIIYGSYDGSIRAIDAAGRLLWEFPVAAFPYDVKAADLDGDRKPEILAATSGSALHVLSPAGKLLWKYSSDRPLMNVVAFRPIKGNPPLVATGGMDRKVQILNGQGVPAASHEVQIVLSRLSAGDLDNDGAEELLAIDNRQTAELLKYTSGRIEQLWRRPLTVPESMKNWENPRGGFFAFSLDIDDIDGDGRREIIGGDTYFNSQAIAVFEPSAQPRWIAGKLGRTINRDTWDEFYSTSFVKSAECNAESAGKEIVTVAGGRLRIFSSTGRLLTEGHSPIGFADLAVEDATAWLGSTPNGDDNIYRVDLRGDIPAQMAALDRRGLAAAMGAELARLRAQVLNHSGNAAGNGQVHDFRIYSVRPTEEAAANAVRQMEWFRARFPYKNVRPTASMRVIEPQQPRKPDGSLYNETRWATDSINGTMTVDQILGAARLLEKHRIPTVIGMGHSCMPFITLETAEKMLQAAPNAILGFLSAEDEQADLVPEYFRHYFGPLADLCVRYGNRQAITKNKNVWWMSMPARQDVYKTLFTPARRQALVANDEDSNSRTPEINLLARAGLRQAGLIDRFDISLIGDLFSFQRFHQWEYPKHGHPYLRLLVAHTVMGGGNYESRLPQFYQKDGQTDISRMGRETIEIFAHMLGKGIVFTPRPDQIAGLNPIGIAVHPMPQKWIEDGHNGHRPQAWVEDPELRNAVIPLNGCLWGNAPTPEHALQRVLLNKQRQFGYHIPPTPFGPFVIVPASAQLIRVEGVRDWWHTDGIYLWREGGPKLTGMDAARAIKPEFEKAAAQLPFRAFGDDVFLQTLHVSPGRYRIYMIDSGWLDPKTRNVTLRVQMAGQFELRDLLRNEFITLSGNSARVEVPAGSLRILEAADATRTSAPFPRIAGEWWTVAGDPGLGPLTTPRQQPVDFAVWQAADGSWQLWSCIRATAAPGRTRLFHRWEGDRLTDRDWKPMGVAMQADPALGETPGGLQAPHVVKVADGFAMMYGDWENICLARSRDGKNFTRYIKPDGKSGLFSEAPGANTRDMMILPVKELYHGYYTAYPNREGAVYLRTSADLINWSPSKKVAFGGQAGVHSFSAECPFVYFHKSSGYYYLFRTQRYGERAQTSVYRSKDPADFGVNDDRYFLGTLPVAAPEIIEQDGKLYMAALLPSLKGIQIAPLEFR